MSRPMTAPVQQADDEGERHRPAPGGQRDGEDGRAGACREAGRQVDLAEQQDEDQAHGQDDDRGALVEQVREVEGREEGRPACSDAEEDDQDDQARGRQAASPTSPPLTRSK